MYTQATSMLSRNTILSPRRNLSFLSISVQKQDPRHTLPSSLVRSRNQLLGTKSLPDETLYTV